MPVLKPGDRVQHRGGTDVGIVATVLGDKRVRVRFNGVLYTFPCDHLIHVRRNFTPDQIEAMYDALVAINHPLIGDLKK